jgi:uncharacterized protein (TIGR03089 family)
MPNRPDTVLAALRSVLATGPGRPLVTFYDGATGERVELSATTFANWVTKVANLFGDELMLEPAQGIRVRLPTHWQSTVSLVGAWTAGLQILGDGADGTAAASVVGPDAAMHADAPDGQVVACSLRPLAGPSTEPLPPGWLDFANAVPSQPDTLLADPGAVGPTDIALVTAAGGLSHGALLDRAVEYADAMGLSAGGRLLTDANPCEGEGMQTALLAPLAVGCSVVLVAHVDEATARGSIAEQEQVTATAWTG